MRNVIFSDNDRLIESLIPLLEKEGLEDFYFVLPLGKKTSMSIDKFGVGEVREFLNDNSDIGSFAVISDDSGFMKMFPNNLVRPVDDVSQVAKSVVFVLTNFNRDPRNVGNLFVISDTHFSHGNIIKYCDRPFRDVEEMNERLIENWNSVVGANDRVIHLGDFSFGNRKRLETVFSRLNGKIDLVMGNHDRLKMRDYYNIGFHRVYDKPMIVSNFFIMSHAPLQWIRTGDVYANIYGHVHNMEMYRDFTRNTFCACVERIGYKPIRMSEILEKMESCQKTT
jgi:Predicted phosphoesterase or phosphohydrolase